MSPPGSPKSIHPSVCQGISEERGARRHWRPLHCPRMEAGWNCRVASIRFAMAAGPLPPWWCLSTRSTRWRAHPYPRAQTVRPVSRRTVTPLHEEDNAAHELKAVQSHPSHASCPSARGSDFAVHESSSDAVAAFGAELSIPSFRSRPFLP